MKKVKYNSDVDVLLIEMSNKKIDYAEDKGQIIIHYSNDGEPVLLEIFDAKNFVLNTLSSIVKNKEVVLE